MPALPPIPGYAEAVRKENEIRDGAFLGVNEIINGVECLPLTARHLLILHAVGSPFVYGSSDKEKAAELIAQHEFEHIAIFLWIVSPQFVRRTKFVFWNPRTWRNALSSRFTQYRFYRSTRHLNAKQTAIAIFDFVENSLLDAPGGDNKPKGPSYFSWLAAGVNILASEYGWSESEILDLPLKRFFQYLRASSRNNDSGAILSNPSQKLIGDFLKNAPPIAPPA